MLLDDNSGIIHYGQMDKVKSEKVVESTDIKPTGVKRSKNKGFIKLIKRLDAHQKTGLIAFSLVALTLPLGIIAAMNEVRQRSKAYFPISSPITPPTSPYPTPTPTPTSIPLPTPSSSPISCQQLPHEVMILPQELSGTPGSTQYYNVYVKNNDSINCSARYFTYTLKQPFDSWSGSVSPPTSYIAPGQSGSVSIGFTSAQNTPLGAYPVGVDVNGATGAVSSTASYHVFSLNPPTPTPSPYPTPTIKPTPSPYPTSSPTPSPRPNIRPTILTRSLPSARVDRNYRGIITAIDRDRNELTFNVKGLPKGLRTAGCDTKVNNKGIFNWLTQCQIVGRPTQIGNFNVIVSVVDSQGGATNKRFVIRVRR